MQENGGEPLPKASPERVEVSPDQLCMLLRVQGAPPPSSGVGSAATLEFNLESSAEAFHRCVLSEG